MVTPAFAVEDPTAADVSALLDAHLAFARAVTPPESVFALDGSGLTAPTVTLFGARLDGRLVGVGALSMLTPDHAELKSMHTAAATRGCGIGQAMVEHLVAEARRRGCIRVSLETGTMDAFAPARRLYRRCGFVDCEPFGPYVDSPTSVCMTLDLIGGSSGDRSPDGG
jgi:putative acetyltransferase